MSEVERLLAAKRARLDRLTPPEALSAQREDALLVDTRPIANREAEGEVPGALVIDRNVLEWRLDPTSADRVPEADSADRLVVLFCNEGYASSLAAVQLQELGLVRATDLVGGFRAWRGLGLPVVEPVRAPELTFARTARPPCAQRHVPFDHARAFPTELVG